MSLQYNQRNAIGDYSQYARSGIRESASDENLGEIVGNTGNMIQNGLFADDDDRELEEQVVSEYESTYHNYSNNLQTQGSRLDYMNA